MLGNPLLELKQVLLAIGGSILIGLVSGVPTQIFWHYSILNLYNIADFFFNIGMWACILAVVCCIFGLLDHSDTAGAIGGLVLIASIAVMFFFRSNGLFIVIAPVFFRIVVWTIWGWLITNAIGLKFPNFDRKNALWAGAAGGAVACIGFLICSSVTSDVSGRLLGACCLGGVIGVLVGLLAYSYQNEKNTVKIFDEETGKEKEVGVGTEVVSVMGGAVSLSINSAGQTVAEDRNHTRIVLADQDSGKTLMLRGGLLSLDDESDEEQEQGNASAEDKKSSPHKEKKAEDTGSKPAQAMELNGYAGKILLLECPQESASDAEVLQKYLGMRPKEVYSIYEKEIILCACKQYPDVFEIQYKPHGLFRKGKKYLVTTRPENAPELSIIGQILIWNAQKRMQLNAPEAQIPATLLVSCPKELEQSYLQSHPTNEEKVKRNKMMCDWLLDRAGIQKQSWDNVSLCEPKTIYSVIEQCIRNLEA